LIGPLVASALSGAEAWVRLVSAAVLLVIAVRGLLASRRPADDTLMTGAGDVASVRRTFTRFAALTLVNPTTALYFAALTTAQGAALDGGAAGAVFVLGVFMASLLWQQLLAAVSALAGARIPVSTRVWTFRAGYGLVAIYAVKVALPLP
jgi:arginine exporter protein ArgO